MLLQTLHSSSKVFALDLHTNRLIYRSGITPETPGGQSWLALDLPILPIFRDEFKVDPSGNHNGPLLPLCPPQEEVIQLIGRVLQLTNSNLDHTIEESLERLSVPGDYDENTVDLFSVKMPPAIILSNKIRRLFTPKHRSQINSLFGSFRHLISRDSSNEEREDSSSWLSEDHTLQKVGTPPARLMFVWAGAMSSVVEQSIPTRWRIASLLTNNMNTIPYFSVDMNILSPEWFQRIEDSLKPSESPLYSKHFEFTDIFNASVPWTEIFDVEVLQSSFSYYSKDRPRSPWVGKQALITHFSSPSHFVELSLSSPSTPPKFFPTEDSAEASPTFLNSIKLTSKDIIWAGFIDSLSFLLPRNARNARRKFAENVPIRKPNQDGLPEIPKRTSLSSSINSVSHLVALFVREEVSSSTVDVSLKEQESFEQDDENVNVFEEGTTMVRSNFIPLWIMRFSSKNEASSWLAKIRFLPEEFPSIGRIWMVTEQAEVFWALGTDIDSNLTWNKISGHFARVESISISGPDGGQVTWALGYNGTPWVLRDDWNDTKKPYNSYSSKQLPFKITHFQTDIRQFRVFEFQSRRIIHGYSSSKAFNERNVMWSRDAQHRESCSLCDIHLPPHNGQVRWLNDWEVDFSPLAGCAPHHTPALSRKSRSISRCVDCDPEFRSPSISPHGSASMVTNEITSSSVGSPGFLVTTPVNSSMVTVAPHPSPSSVLPTYLIDGGMYVGSDEGFVYATMPCCDAKGWIYTSRSSSCGHQTHRPHDGNGGVRHRRWVRSCVVCTEAPWQEMGRLKIKSLSMTRVSANPKTYIETWAVTDAGELVCRRDVTPSNPAGSRWVHHPVPRRLQFVATAPESGSRLILWTICADFGLLWQQVSTLPDQRPPLDGLEWRCLGFSPTGFAWHRLAPVTAHCLWALDVDGKLWVHLGNQQGTTVQKKSVGDDTWTMNWTKVSSPRISDISCSSDGKVWAVFSSTNALGVRTGITREKPIGTGWLRAFEGIASSVCIKGGIALD